MKLKFIIISILFLGVSCAKKTDPFLITPQSIGELTNKSRVSDLESIYVNDSIVKQIAGDGFAENNDKIKILDKKGNDLLRLEAKAQFDSIATITSVRIMNAKYKTDKGIGLTSTFGEISKNYKISKITNTLSSVIVNLDEINAFVVIDKKELPTEFMFDTDTNIEASQIPNEAKLKYFWLDWTSF